MSKNQIFCKKCNAKFNSMLDFIDHTCPNEETAPKWSKKIGRNSKEKNIVQQQLEDNWLVQAEQQRKKKKSRPVYKKNYRRNPK